MQSHVINSVNLSMITLSSTLDPYQCDNPIHSPHVHTFHDWSDNHHNVVVQNTVEKSINHQSLFYDNHANSHSITKLLRILSSLCFAIIQAQKRVVSTNISIKRVFLLCILVNFIACSSLEVITCAHHTCVLSDSHKVKCFGNNEFGQLGYGDIANRGGAPGEMGSNLSVIELGDNFNVTQIATGFGHTCALSESNSMKCWGHNVDGQLGYGDMDNRGNEAGEMSNNLLPINLGPGFNIVQITTGKEHTCALSNSSAVKCWGQNTWGQLGYEDTTKRGDTSATTPNNLLPIDLGSNFTVIQITSPFTKGRQSLHTCALSSSYSVKCWGRNNVGQLGYGDIDNRGDEFSEMGDALKEVDLGTNFDVKDIVTGYDHTCALSHSNEVKCWGNNNYAQLGYEDLENRGYKASQMGDQLPTVNLGTDFNVTQISTGFAHTCALSKSNTVKCWGRDFFGELGYGSVDDRRGDQSGEMGESLPIVDLGTNFEVVQIVASFYYTCAVSRRNTIKCWGDNRDGKLGYGDLDKRDNITQMGDSLLEVNTGFPSKPTAEVAETTYIPTLSPIKSPTEIPSIHPSTNPSRIPSYSSLFVPSNQPSTTPSDQPSITPSEQPSIASSYKASTTPFNHNSTRYPSSTPSHPPSTALSDQPVTNSSNAHTSSSPSVEETSYPTFVSIFNITLSMNGSISTEHVVESVTNLLEIYLIAHGISSSLDTDVIIRPNSVILVVGVSSHLVRDFINSTDLERQLSDDLDSEYDGRVKVNVVRANDDNKDNDTDDVTEKDADELSHILVVIASGTILIACCLIIVVKISKRKQKIFVDTVNNLSDDNKERDAAATEPVTCLGSESSDDIQTLTGVVTPRNIQMMDVASYQNQVHKDAGNNLLEVYEWFQDALQLPQYMDIFVSNGYESMQIIKEIADDEELKEIGILSHEHRIMILDSIEMWKQQNIADNKRREGSTLFSNATKKQAQSTKGFEFTSNNKEEMLVERSDKHEATTKGDSYVDGDLNLTAEGE